MFNSEGVASTVSPHHCRPRRGRWLHRSARHFPTCTTTTTINIFSSRHRHHYSPSSSPSYCLSKWPPFLTCSNINAASCWCSGVSAEHSITYSYFFLCCFPTLVSCHHVSYLRIHEKKNSLGTWCRAMALGARRDLLLLFYDIPCFLGLLGDWIDRY